MAYLFKLPIEGMGTPDMESFWSYLVRLSIHHAVPLRRFLATCINIFNYKFESTIRMEWPRHLTEFIRPNSSTERVLTVVECLTDLYDLRATTLISLGNLPRMVDCLEDIPKWCAECLREREEKKMPMYFKLIWNFKDVKACHIHSIPLVTNCICGNYRYEFYSRFLKNPFRCSKCNSSLGAQREDQKLVPSWAGEGADLLKLIEFIGQHPGLEFPSGGVNKIVRLASERFKKSGINEAAAYHALCRVCYAEPGKYISGKKTLSLCSARKLSVLMGMPLVDALLGIDRGDFLNLYNGWLGYLPRRPVKVRLDKNHILEKINECLNNAETPLSMLQISKRVGVSQGYLSYHFPDLRGLLLERYRKWRTSRMLGKRVLARKEALAYFLGRRKESFGNSRKQAYKFLREKTGLPKNVLRLEIKQVYEQLFLKKGESGSPGQGAAA